MIDMCFAAKGTGGVQGNFGIQKAVAGIVTCDAFVVQHPVVRAFKNLLIIGANKYELHDHHSQRLTSAASATMANLDYEQMLIL